MVLSVHRQHHLFLQKFIFQYNDYETRLMNNRLRMVVAELSFQKQPAFWRLRFPEVCCLRRYCLPYLWRVFFSRNAVGLNSGGLRKI
jgi:hypothetical protein